jgi:hypothetical protein
MREGGVTIARGGQCRFRNLMLGWVMLCSSYAMLRSAKQLDLAHNLLFLAWFLYRFLRAGLFSLSLSLSLDLFAAQRWLYPFVFKTLFSIDRAFRLCFCGDLSFIDFFFFLVVVLRSVSLVFLLMNFWVLFIPLGSVGL